MVQGPAGVPTTYVDMYFVTILLILWFIYVCPKLLLEEYLTVFWDATSGNLDLTAQRHITEKSILHSYCYGNLKANKSLLVLIMNLPKSSVHSLSCWLVY
jgi:hypothetical protein